MIITKKRITEILYYVFFALLFCFDASMPNRSLLLFFIILMSIFVNLNMNLRINMNRGDASKYIIMLYLISVLTDIYSNGNYQSGIINLLLFTLIYISLGKYCDSMDSFKKLIKIVFITTFIGGPIIGIYQMATGNFLYTDSATSIYVNYKIFNAQQSNVNYGALTMQLAFFASLIVSNFSKHKYLYYTGAIISSVCVILTFSRGAIASTAISLLIIIFYKKKYSVKRWIRVFILVLICGVLFNVYYQNIIGFVYSDNVQNLFSQKEASSLTDRSQQWKAAIDAFMNGNVLQMLFGYGSDYASVLGRYSGESMTAHNIFFGQLSQNGLVGLILIFAVFINGMKKIIKLNKHKIVTLEMCCFMLAIWMSYQLLSLIRWEFLIIIILFDKYFRIINKQRSDTDIYKKIKVV